MANKYVKPADPELWDAHFAGDKKATDDLITHYFPMVELIAGKMYLPEFLELDELTSAGMTGLMKAVEKFDPERSPKFEYYLIWIVRNHIIDYLRRLDWAPKDIRDKQRKLNKVQKALRKTHTNIEDSDIADAMEITVADLKRLRDDIASTYTLPFANDPESPVHSKVSQDPADIYIDDYLDLDRSLEPAIQCLRSLTLQQKVVLVSMIVHGENSLAAGRKLGLTRNAAAAILGETLEFLRLVVAKTLEDQEHSI